MADITGAQKIQMRRMIDDFQDGMKVKLLNYQKVIMKLWLLKDYWLSGSQWSKKQLK